MYTDTHTLLHIPITHKKRKEKKNTHKGGKTKIIQRKSTTHIKKCKKLKEKKMHSTCQKSTKAREKITKNASHTSRYGRYGDTWQLSPYFSFRSCFGRRSSTCLRGVDRNVGLFIYPQRLASISLPRL